MMKIKAVAAIVLGLLLQTACSSRDNEKNESSRGTPIDSSVVGKDTSPVSTRKNIDMSDEQKMTLPGRDTTNSDERQ